VAALNGPDRLVCHGTYTVDTAGNFARIVILSTSLLIVDLCFRDVRSHARETEFYVLPLYTVVAFRKNALGTEAAIVVALLGPLVQVKMLVRLKLLEVEHSLQIIV
jgi:hypothetical protein